MPCKQCKQNPVIQLSSGVTLCKSCFIKYFEKKVFKTIGKYNLIKKGEKIGVALSGGKASLTTLNLLDKLTKKRLEISLVAIAIDEGSAYRKNLLKYAEKFCKKNKIPLFTYSFKKEFGMTIVDMAKKLNGENPCTACSILRRQLLNKKARELKLDKLATGHNLDDEAQAIMMNQFRRNSELSARLGPITGVVTDKRFVRRIKPLYFMLEKEVAIYAFLRNFFAKHPACPYAADSYRSEVKDMLNNFEADYLGTKNSIITSFMEILPLLKEHYKTSKKIRNCEKCGEPCSQKICTACQTLKRLKE